MLKLVPAFFAASLIAVPALSGVTSRSIDFERDGIHYVGTVMNRNDGTMRIVGHEVESGRDFALMVRKGRVTGNFGGEAVAYDVPASRTGTELAAAND